MKCFICNNNMLPYFKKEFPKIFIGGGATGFFAVYKVWALWSCN